MTMVETAAASTATAGVIASTTTCNNNNDIPHLTNEQLRTLEQRGWVVIPNFISITTTTALRQDLLQLHADGYFSVSKIGHDGIIQDTTTPFRDIRHSETCPLMLNPNMTTSSNSSNPEEECKEGHNCSVTRPPAAPALLVNSPARTELYEILNGLRHDLQNNGGHANGRVLDETLEEVMYAYYPIGGYYKRHLDAEQYSVSCWRQYSFLLYLNDNQNWNASIDGGQLRLHRDSGADVLPVNELPNFLDIIPNGGTLVIFKSNIVPHEVLPTNKERTAVVGWFLAKDIIPNNHDDKKTTTTANHNSMMISTTIYPEALVTLRALRQAVPGLERKLKPQSSIATSSSSTPDHHQYQSGMLGNDDWGIVMDVTPPTCTALSSSAASSSTAPTLPDTDPRYWKTIAAFDEDGYISTLSLGGQRLRKLPDVSVLLDTALWKRVVTVDLANTDLPVSALCQVFEQIARTPQQQQQTWSLSSLPSPRLTQLYLGGNALGSGSSGGGSKSNSGLVEIMPHLTSTAIVASLQVLDLRFNDLDPSDAVLLAKFLQHDSCRCEKLYLEGNALGDEGAQHLANSNGNNIILRELYLGANGIGPNGAAALAMGLVGRSGSRLEKLYLEGNCIGPEGARSFIEVLENAKDNGGVAALQKLYVDNNNIGKAEAIRLGQALNSATVIGE